MFSYGIMPPLMFAGMISFLLLGFPVAFSLAAVGLLFGLIGIMAGHFSPDFLQAIPFRYFGTISNELLLAIPFFTFMGAVLERSGLAEDLLDGMGRLFGRLPGGLAFSVVIVGAIMGAITGTVAASVIAMGVIALPMMLRYGYEPRIATGVIAASGTITQIIPPSLVLIILADQLHRSVGDMYLGAIVPSLLQVLLFIAFIAFLAVFQPHRMPALPLAASTEQSTLRLAWRILRSIVPCLGLMFLVLGTIFLGLATPTEAGAMGALGALVLAALYRRLTWAHVSSSMGSTARMTAMVIFILFGATCFTLVFQGVSGGLWIEGLLHNLPGGEVAFLLFVNVFIFVLAFFLDFFEIAFIVIPLLAPVADKMGIDLIWFGILICVNMQTSFMHPPFGVALFYLRGIAPKSVRSSDIYWGAVPWICLQLLLVGILIFFPQSVSMWRGTEHRLDPTAIEQKLDQIKTSDDLYDLEATPTIKP